MNKIAGNVKYPFGVGSPSDPSGVGLGFTTKTEAQRFADTMNRAAQVFGDDWNKSHWKSKPDPFIVFEL